MSLQGMTLEQARSAARVVQGIRARQRVAQIEAAVYHLHNNAANKIQLVVRRRAAKNRRENGAVKEIMGKFRVYGGLPSKIVQCFLNSSKWEDPNIDAGSG